MHERRNSELLAAVRTRASTKQPSATTLPDSRQSLEVVAVPADEEREGQLVGSADLSNTGL